MPIYEYECEKCGVTFEAMQTISAKPMKTCNGLGCDEKDNGKVRRIVSQSGSSSKVRVGMHPITRQKRAKKVGNKKAINPKRR
ncbi:MAG: hypothetical protein Ct9H300mP23_09470 [Nitrospinota bacterium]|nr:MAG: hypothetical protein Ct9H300mP23_09470 [Nitrospinota bacterium]